MISSLLAGLVLAIQTRAEAGEPDNPNEAVCRPTGQFADGQIVNIGLSCPAVETDPDGFVAYLQAMLDAMPEAVTIPQVENVSINDTIRFIHDEAGWRLSEPTPFIRVAPLYPVEAARNGWSGACLTRYRLSGNFQINIDETVCVRDGREEPRRTRNFMPETHEALSHFVWLPFPGAETACGVHRVDYSMANLFPPPAEGEEPDPRMPESVNLIPDEAAVLACP